MVPGTFNIPKTGEGILTIKAGTYPPGNYYYSLVLDGQVHETKQTVQTR